MKRILLVVVSVLLLANIVQFCNSSVKNSTIEVQKQQLDCFNKCQGVGE